MAAVWEDVVRGSLGYKNKGIASLGDLANPVL